MNKQSRSRNLVAICLLATNVVYAQPVITESGSSCKTPQDGIYQKSNPKEKRALEYDYVHEKDVFWEKRIWEVIDLSEQRNNFFSYKKQPFINILMQHAQEGDITLYSTFDDEFKIPLDARQVHELSGTADTITIYDPITLQEKTEIVYSAFDPNTVTEYRIKEVWFFDEETSRLRVRILGIAPIQDVYDERGNFIATMPMFWAYYPELRGYLAQHEFYNEQNDASRLSWEDVFEMRFFSARVMKESNVHDRRITDYLVGIDALLEGEKIRESIRNFEHDLWEW